MFAQSGHPGGDQSTLMVPASCSYWPLIQKEESTPSESRLPHFDVGLQIGEGTDAECYNGEFHLTDPSDWRIPSKPTTISTISNPHDCPPLRNST
jgi:hypothetical protein